MYTHLEIANLAREAAGSAFDMARDTNVPFPTSEMAGEFIVELHADEWDGEGDDPDYTEAREGIMSKTLYFNCVYNRSLQQLQNRAAWCEGYSVDPRQKLL